MSVKTPMLRWLASLAVAVVLAVPAAVAVASSPLSNDPTPLAVCQATIRAAALDLADATRRGVGACLTRGTECVAGPETEAAACCKRAASRCAGDLRKVELARRRFGVYLANRRCAAVPFAAMLSDLGYERLAERCAALEPPGSIATLADLIDCLASLTASETSCLIGTVELPRAPEALECLDLGPAFQEATGADLATCAAAVVASPSPSPSPSPTIPATATPTKTATPLPTATTTIAPTATSSVVTTATPVRTATPIPTTTIVPTTTATATIAATASPVATVTIASPPSASPTSVATGSPTRTATPAAVATATTTPSAAATAVPTASATAVATVTATLTATPIPSATPTPVTTITSAPTGTRTATPVPTATTTPSGPVCGNGTKETGEDCDDGNTLDCDTCPSTCHTAPADCAPAGTTRAPQKVTVHLTNGESLTSALFCLRYPAGTVGIPGTGGVPQRVSGFAGQTSLNDFNSAAQIALLGRNVLSELNLTVSFDLCSGATAPPPTAFSCAVVSASNAGNSLDPKIVQCDAVAP